MCVDNHSRSIGVKVYHLQIEKVNRAKTVSTKCVPSKPTSCTDEARMLARIYEKFGVSIQKAAAEHDIDPRFIVAAIGVESGGDFE